uniref:Glycosyltransferase family 92 protein n=1 Tax=Panagrolaimus sp. PS1159 TaxID=55785 RepID=A0AC35GT56_9BILA
MWSSRNNLSISAAFIFFLILILRYFPKDLPEITVVEQETIEDGPFLSLIYQAKEEIDYLHDIIRGKAEIAPVVESERILNFETFCQKLRIDNIKIAKKHEWTKNFRWWLFSAHFDSRQNSLFPGKNSIQILASIFLKPPSTPYCLIQYPHSTTPIVVEAILRPIWQRAWDPRFSFYNSFLITCGLPKNKKNEVPKSISLIPTKCPSKLYTNIPIQNNKPKKDGTKKPLIGVCLKGLDFMEDRSQHLIEWIEFQILMKADKIVIYVYSITSETRKALKYYSEKGKVEIVDLTLPGFSPNTPFIRHNFIARNRQQKRRSELIPYNDCFLRFSQSHEYVLIVDSDEFVVPLKHENWPDMLESLKNQKFHSSSFAIRNVFKLETFDHSSNSPLKMLSNNFRSKIVQDKGISEKSFINTKTIATVFNHFALHRLFSNVTRTQHIDPEIAIKLHYKPNCPEELGLHCKEIVENPIKDESLDRFVTKLEENVAKVLSIIRN